MSDLRPNVASSQFDWNVSHGTLSLGLDGDFSYTPDKNFVGTDSFTYVAFGGALNSNVATVTINVMDQAPFANAASYYVQGVVATAGSDGKITPTTYSFGNLLTNAGDADGDLLTAVLVSSTSQGKLTLSPGGSFSYSRNDNGYGGDSFTYRVSDGIYTSASATVTINVVNDTVIAVGDSYTLNPGNGSVSGDVLSNDFNSIGGSVAAKEDGGPGFGTLQWNNNGSFTYTANPGFFGTDSFSYHDEVTTWTYPAGAEQPVAVETESNTATVSILVANPTLGPGTAIVSPANKSYTVTHDQLLVELPSYGVSANALVWRSGTMFVNLVSNVQHGTLNLLPSGAFTYLPNAGYVGKDSFTYSINNSSSATATIQVVDTAPQANNDSYGMTHDNILTVSQVQGVLANDTDAENDSLTAVLVTGTTHGVLGLDSNGSFNYTPDAGFVGTDSFTYQANDGIYSSNVVFVTIQVNESAPQASNDSYSVSHDQTLTESMTNGVSVNDTDADGDFLTALLVSNPQNGSVLLKPDGAFSYTPNGGFVGTDSFLYQVSDGILDSNIALVRINVTDAAPVVQNASFTTAHDTALIVDPLSGLLSTTADAEGDPLTLNLVNGVSHGALTLNPQGSFTYVPDADFIGTDEFTYQVSDGLLSSATAVVTITVTGGRPSAVNDSYSVAHDTSLIVSRWDGVLANDTDASGDPLTASVIADPVNGTLSFSPSGAFVYAPDAGFVGTDQFTYADSDGFGSSRIATVTLTVTADAAPTATAASYSVVHDTPLIVTPWQGVLANDTAASGNALTAVLVGGPTHGTLILNVGGSFLYTPVAGFIGTDEFTYQAYDGTQLSNVAAVTIQVTDAAPTSANVSYTLVHDTSLVLPQWSGPLVNATDADGDPISASVLYGPAHGALTFTSSGSMVYTPNAGFIGTDEFSYQTNDGILGGSIAVVTLKVTDAAPATTASSYTLPANTTLSEPTWQGVLVNASDADGDVLTATLFAGPAHGTLTLGAAGSFTYTPYAGYAGPDSFSYTASDGILSSAATTVTLQVTDAPPAAQNVTYLFTPGQTLIVGEALGVLGNDSVGGSAVLTAALVSGVSDGVLDFAADGSFSYIPSAGFNGTDSFRFQVSDGLGVSAIATATLQVGTAPQAGNDSYTVLHDHALIVPPGAANDLLANAATVNGQPLTVTLASGPGHGTLTLSADGSFTYVPDAGFVGTDSFTYTASDGLESSNTATVTITVTNAPPTVGAASYTVHAGLLLTASSSTGVLAGAHDADGDLLTATLVTTTNHGTLTLLGTGAFVYVPNGGFVGTDSFTYAVSDGVSTVEATASIQVTDAAPTAGVSSYTVTHDAPLVVNAAQGLLANAQDADGNALTLVVATGTTNGAVSVNADGSFLYTPNAGFVGTDSLDLHQLCWKSDCQPQNQCGFTIRLVSIARHVQSDDEAESRKPG